MHKLSATLTLVFLTTTFAAAQPGRVEDEAAIKRVIDAFIATREDDAAEALRNLLTEDVDQQVTSGQMRTGRAAVVDGSLATTQSTGGERVITIETIRFITPDVAIADGPYDITGRSDGPDRHYRTSIVLERERGQWKIAAIRNMQPTQ